MHLCKSISNVNNCYRLKAVKSLIVDFDLNPFISCFFLPLPAGHNKWSVFQFNVSEVLKRWINTCQSPEFDFPMRVLTMRDVKHRNCPISERPAASCCEKRNRAERWANSTSPFFRNKRENSPNESRNSCKLEYLCCSLLHCLHLLILSLWKKINQ